MMTFNEQDHDGKNMHLNSKGGLHTHIRTIGILLGSFWFVTEQQHTYGRALTVVLIGCFHAICIFTQ